MPEIISPEERIRQVACSVIRERPLWKYIVITICKSDHSPDEQLVILPCDKDKAEQT
jgi:hypothetical protein